MRHDSGTSRVTCGKPVSCPHVDIGERVQSLRPPHASLHPAVSQQLSMRSFCPSRSMQPLESSEAILGGAIQIQTFPAACGSMSPVRSFTSYEGQSSGAGWVELKIHLYSSCVLVLRTTAWVWIYPSGSTDCRTFTWLGWLTN